MTLQSDDYYDDLERSLREDADMIRAQYNSTARLSGDDAADAIRDLRAALKVALS